jgi:hypothetical protein
MRIILLIDPLLYQAEFPELQANKASKARTEVLSPDPLLMTI